jgi:cytochrome c oxidase subunit 3
MVEAHKENVETSADSLPSFLRLSNRELGVWLFLLSDALTFAAMLLAYGYLRVSNGNFPTPFTFNPHILSATSMTIALFAGVLLMHFAVTETTKKGIRRWLLLTLIAGIIFVALQATEWLNLRNAGLSFSTLPQNWRVGAEASPIFGAAFFTITGIHLLHIVVGVLLLIWFIVRLNTTSQEKIKALRLYWNYLCAGWLFVFVFLYLLSVDVRN